MSEYIGEPFNPYSLKPHGSRKTVVRTHGGVPISSVLVWISFADKE